MGSWSSKRLLLNELTFIALTTKQSTNLHTTQHQGQSSLCHSPQIQSTLSHKFDSEQVLLLPRFDQLQIHQKKSKLWTFSLMNFVQANHSDRRDSFKTISIRKLGLLRPSLRQKKKCAAPKRSVRHGLFCMQLKLGCRVPASSFSPCCVCCVSSDSITTPRRHLGLVAMPVKGPCYL